MIPIEVKLDQGQHDPGAPIWDDIDDEGKFVMAEEGWKVATLRNGTASGRASVVLRLDMSGGGVVIAQTSARAFLMAAAAIRGAHGPDGDR